MDVHSLFRAAPPYLHLWIAPLADAYEFAWSIQRTPGRQAIVRVIRGSKSQTAAALFDECGAALQFPDYFGENWDALFECLTDLEWLPGDAYLIVVTDSQLVLDREASHQFHGLLDVLEHAAQDWAQAEDSQGTARPFHVVFQCAPDRASQMQARVRETGNTLETL
jgi:RNAse (barnase) inhibitor barstar